MNQKIVKIRKLDDIDKNDWEIHFDNETQIVYKHEELFKIVELGLSREKPVIKKEETDTPIFFPKDEEWENLKKKEKNIVKKFREDVKNLSSAQFKKKYAKIKGDDILDD
jgi:hypothetical protein|tara:strand:+ start:182 stop:511 length:330 start_codon:yes stop_codon:yes gene_type:complete